MMTYASNKSLGGKMPIENGQWDDTKEQVRTLLGKKDDERIQYIRKYVTGIWKGRKFQVYYTLHDSSHNVGVEHALYKLIPIQNENIPLCASSGKKSLTGPQWFCLLAAAWLHDVGMLPNILNADKFKNLRDLDKIRRIHNERSRDYIQEKRDVLQLNDEECYIIKTICEFHRKSVSMENCPPDHDLPLLAAYLRLADGIHINYERINDDLFQLFEFIGMPESSRFHWIKSKLIHTIIPDPNNLSIDVCFKFKQEEELDSTIVSNMIVDEIKSELHTVRNILIKGGISYYLDVNIGDGISGDGNVRVLLKQMIDSVRLDTWASASDVADCLVDSITYLNTLADKERSIEILSNYQESIVRKNLNTRTCHVIIDKIFNIINKNLGLSGQVTPEVMLANIAEEVLEIKNNREKAVEKIAENAKVILNDNESILLFGHSKIVLRALEKVEDKQRTPIYICEGRNSGRYSYTNELEYCDGLEYAKSVMALGFTNVNLIPDILVGNLLARKENGIQKIVFGANGIDIKKASFGHTAGHLSIATLAKTHKIPVYVLADSFKFGNLNYNEKIERHTPWLMGEGSQCITKLRGINLFNPREDEVDAEYIYLLITEKGGFPPERIPEIIKSEYNEYTRKFC